METLKADYAIFPLDIWRNDKHGTLYRVHDVVKHSETQEDMVIYSSITDHKQKWVRPLALFKEKFTFQRRSAYAKK